MRILVWSDLHMHSWHEAERAGAWHDALKVISEVKALVQDLKIDHVVFCGDLFEAKRALRTDVAVSTVYALNHCGLHEDMSHVHYVAGNHDRYYPEHCVLDLLRYPGGPNVYSEAFERLLVEDTDGTKYTLAFLPHGVNKITASEARTDYDVLFMHHNLNGAEVAPNISTQKEATSVSSLLLRAGKRKLVVNGHYHVPQQIVDKHQSPAARVSVVCVGAPISLTWADLEEPKYERQRGCVVIDLTAQGASFTRLPLWENFPRFFREGDPRIRVQGIPKDYVLQDTTQIINTAVSNTTIKPHDDALTLWASVDAYVKDRLVKEATPEETLRHRKAGMQYATQQESDDDLIVADSEDDDDLFV